MKLYSNCCQQQDYAIKLPSEKKPYKARTVLEHWPNMISAPKVPQLLYETTVRQLPLAVMLFHLLTK